MAELVANCPRCGARSITFDVTGSAIVGKNYSWQHIFELFCVCRNCHRSTVFLAYQRKTEWSERKGWDLPQTFNGSLNDHFEVRRFVSLVDSNRIEAPEHTPAEIAAIFGEAASSVVFNNWNAAGAMFRLAINLATKPLLPAEATAGLTRRKRRDLGPRVEWLMANGRISRDLYDLSECIREDGNDGAHDGTLTKEDAADLLDFTMALFERMFTEPERLRLAGERRDKRRATTPEQEEK